jgi:phosphomannomutase
MQINSAASEILQVLLSRIGCETIPLHCDQTGTFSREPEPTVENLSELSQKVVEHGADVGFATDPDGDRISVVSEKGIPLGEEYSLTMAAELVLRERPGPVVANVATTMAVEDVARKHGCPFARAAVGEINVVEKMKEMGAVIGGEGNGGVINPAVQYARDGPGAMALILEGLSRSGGPLSDMAKGLPEYYMVKKKIPCDPSKSQAILDDVQSHFRDERVDLTDGVRVMLDAGSIYVRRSGTEPIIRVICEAKSEEAASSLVRDTVELVETSRRTRGA